MGARRLRVFVMAALAASLAGCTIPSDDGAAAEGPAAVTVTATETETEFRDRETTATETATVAETTLTTTATRWAIGDPAEATNPNEQLFGPYLSQDACEDLAEAECVERDDGWYLDLRDSEDEEDDADDAEDDEEPASPSESGRAGDTD